MNKSKFYVVIFEDTGTTEYKQSGQNFYPSAGEFVDDNCIDLTDGVFVRSYAEVTEDIALALTKEQSMTEVRQAEGEKISDTGDQISSANLTSSTE